jgi:hypothetical protein
VDDEDGLAGGGGIGIVGEEAFEFGVAVLVGDCFFLNFGGEREDGGGEKREELGREASSPQLGIWQEAEEADSGGGAACCEMRVSSKGCVLCGAVGADLVACGARASGV